MTQAVEEIARVLATNKTAWRLYEEDAKRILSTGIVKEMREALEEANNAVNASYEQANAEWHDHISIENKCDAVIQKWREKRRTVLAKFEDK